MNWSSTIANCGWLGVSVSDAVAFRRSLGNPARTQADLLRSYVARNADTAFGRQHRLASVRDVEGFRSRVPVREYDEFEDWIEQIKAGRQRVLTAEPVTRLVPSSGTTRAAKLIPYTTAFQKELNRAIGPWMCDLFARFPTLLAGPAYWSVTPAVSQVVTRDSAVPIGYGDDAEYLGGLRRWMINAAMAVPPFAERSPDIDTFRQVACTHLLACDQLRLISVWHPSFLELLLRHCVEHWDSLLDAVQQFSRTRARRLRELGCENWRGIWPHLRLISCWADAHAAGPADALGRIFPACTIQPKGILATEAFISIPFAGQWPLVVRSHFFEFEQDGQIRLAHQLRCGELYRLIVTTAGGLWRVRLGDVVCCDGFVHKTPSLRLIGRADLVVDRFGEKLSEGFVGTVIRRLLSDFGITAPFAMLAPEQEPERLIYYVMFVECHFLSDSDLASELDRRLSENPHYAYCRMLGQLGPPRVRSVARGAYQTFVRRRIIDGQRLGDIKPVALDGAFGWGAQFLASAKERPQFCDSIAGGCHT